MLRKELLLPCREKGKSLPLGRDAADSHQEPGTHVGLHKNRQRANSLPSDELKIIFLIILSFL